jgi:L-arabinokinase
MNNELPFEVSEFEQLLNKPNRDPAGFAGFFNAGEVGVARVPARLNVMGGIADYSGANVCGAVLSVQTNRHSSVPLTATIDLP